ncbi:MAG: DUF2911 domain-containing protein [Candidatus Dormibacteraceae bacterium]
MKRLRTSLMALAVVCGLSVTVFAQGNPRGTSKITVNGQTVDVEYGRPSLKGRTVSQLLSKLKPGQFWRLGADKSTTFTASADLDFNGTKVPKGIYSLWAERQANNSWKLVFNGQHGQWGTSHDPSKDLVSVPLKEGKSASSAEMVTISLAESGSGGKITINWGDLELSTDFTVAS